MFQSSKQPRFKPVLLPLTSLFLFVIFFFLLASIPNASAEVGKRAMVVTADKRATTAAYQVLRGGGNAVDAAVAAQWVLNVVEPQSSGIGGGGFFMYYDAATKSIHTFDGREKAPAEAFPEMFIDEKTGAPMPFYPDRITGGLPVGVPGTLKLLHTVHGKFGSKKYNFGDLFDPAILLAENGFHVTSRLFYHTNEEALRLKRFEASRKIFFNEEGDAYKPRDILFQKDLAETFKLIKQDGINVFYEGEIARDIVDAVRNASYHPGHMKMEDLLFYNVEVRDPVRGNYRGYDVFSMGPPSSGGSTLIQALHILEGFNVRLMGRTPEGIHVFSEAQKLAFQDRNKFIGDPVYSDVPLEKLISKEFARSRSAEITANRTLPVTVPSKPMYMEGMHTSHISIVDQDGNMVSFTTTIESVFGSGMVVPGRGFLLNNELTDFNEIPRNGKDELHPNAVEGDKRPRSSMTPTFVFKKGEPFLIAGTPGGSTIIGTVLNIIVNVIDLEMPLKQAMVTPRIINRNGPTELEGALYANDLLKDQLEQMGHRISERVVIGNAQAIHFESPERIVGESDPRGEGTAQGY